MAAFLLVAAIVAAYFTSPSGDDGTSLTLSDVAANKEQFIASGWLGALAGLLMLPVFAGLYLVLRQWGEDWTRLAFLLAVLSGVLFALAGVTLATVATNLAPRWTICDFDCQVVRTEGTTLLTLRNGLTTVAFVLLALALLPISSVMLKSRGLWWTRLAWLGFAGVVFAILAAYGSAPGGNLVVPDVLPGLFVLVWVLGVGVGLLRLHHTADGPG